MQKKEKILEEKKEGIDSPVFDDRDVEIKVMDAFWLGLSLLCIKDTRGGEIFPLAFRIVMEDSIFFTLIASNYDPTL